LTDRTYRIERRLVLKKYAAASIALVLVALLALGCGSSSTSSRTPSQTVKVFFDDILRGDAAASYALITATDKKVISESVWKQSVEKQAASAKAGGPVTVNVKSSKTSGGGAVVSVELKQGTDIETVNIVTVKEGGAWKVSPQQTEGINAP